LFNVLDIFITFSLQNVKLMSMWLFLIHKVNDL